MLGGSGVAADAVSADVDAVVARTDRPFGVNFLMPFLDLGVVDAVAPRCRVVELFYGDPDASLVERVHDAGAVVSWQIGSVDEGAPRSVRRVESAADIVVDLVRDLA